MSDDARPAELDLATAEEITAALTAIARDLPAGVGKLNHWQELEGGLLTVRFAGDHMVCHYDPAVADTAAWDHELRQHLGDRRASLVRYQPARTPPAELVALLERVLRFDWHPRARAHGVAAGIDWQREVLEITIEAPATDELARTLVRLVGKQGVVTTGAKFGRRSSSGCGSGGPGTAVHRRSGSRGPVDEREQR